MLIYDIWIFNSAAKSTNVYNNTIRREIGLEIRHSGVMTLCVIEDKTAFLLLHPVRFKALIFTFMYLRSTCDSRLLSFADKSYIPCTNYSTRIL